MKIFYVSAFYHPESIAGAFRAAENARIWQNHGHDVTVFTGYPNYPTGKVFDGYQVKLLSEERIDEVRILRSKLIAKPTKNLFTRLVNVISFMFFGLINFMFNGRKIGKDYDVVLGTSGPIFTGILAWVFAACHKIPFVFEIRDITYRQMMATGDGSMGTGAKVMRLLELFLCRKAQKVVVVTEGFKKILSEDGIPADKIEVITNGVDVTLSEYQEREKLVLSYFGTLGISQNIMDTMPYAQEISKLCKDFEYLIIGEGAQREMISAEVSNRKLSFVRMMRGMPMAELERYYDQSLLSVITLKKSENFRYTLPSKLFQVMGRGIAVLFIGPEGEAADIVRKYHAGIALTGTREDDLVKIKAFFEKPEWKEMLFQMGRNGAKAVAEHYSRTELAEKYEEVLSSCVK